MKKLLGIVVLGLLLSGNAYAELITLTKCFVAKERFSGGGLTKGKTYKSFSNFVKINEARENVLYTLDTVTETITKTIVHKDKYIDDAFKNSSKVINKFYKSIYIITDLGGNVATGNAANLKFPYTKDEINVDFVTNKVYTNWVFEDFGKGAGKRSFEEKCARQK